MSRARPSAGFTLVELTVAILLVSITMAFIYQKLWYTVRTRDMLVRELESPKIESAVLDMIARDFRFLYYQEALLPGNSGFWGRSKSLNAKDADRVDFLTSRVSRIAELEDATAQPGDSPLGEVGYACRPNDANSKWLELWRREDYFVDDDPTDGGKFSLVYDKVRRFSLRYYPTPEAGATDDKNGLEEWDSKTSKKVPYAIILDMWYDIHDPPGDEPERKVTKIFLLKPARSLDANAGMETGMTAMR